MQEILEFIKTYGFPAVIVVIVLLGAGKMAWVIINSWIDTMKATMLALENANKRWQEVVDKMTLSIDKHTQDSREAHLYTRQEHKEITEQQKIVTENLKSVGEAIGRINGYTKPH